MTTSNTTAAAPATTARTAPTTTTETTWPPEGTKFFGLNLNEGEAGIMVFPDGSVGARQTLSLRASDLPKLREELVRALIENAFLVPDIVRVGDTWVLEGEYPGDGGDDRLEVSMGLSSDDHDLIIVTAENIVEGAGSGLYPRAWGDHALLLSILWHNGLDLEAWAEDPAGLLAAEQIALAGRFDLQTLAVLWSAQGEGATPGLIGDSEDSKVTELPGVTIVTRCIGSGRGHGIWFYGPRYVSPAAAKAAGHTYRIECACGQRKYPL